MNWWLTNVNGRWYGLALRFLECLYYKEYMLSHSFSNEHRDAIDVDFCSIMHWYDPAQAEPFSQVLWDQLLSFLWAKHSNELMLILNDPGQIFNWNQLKNK